MCQLIYVDILLFFIVYNFVFFLTFFFTALVKRFIFQLLVEQFPILETMTPLDFMQFRSGLFY